MIQYLWSGMVYLIISLIIITSVFRPLDCAGVLQLRCLHGGVLLHNVQILGRRREMQTAAVTTVDCFIYLICRLCL
jgi:hypothetical protein